MRFNIVFNNSCIQFVIAFSVFTALIVVNSALVASKEIFSGDNFVQRIDHRFDCPLRQIHQHGPAVTQRSPKQIERGKMGN
jgi:hypothetical protein